jgi:branched-chain amino acid transport system permease protein
MAAAGLLVAYGVQQRLWPAPLGVLVQGMVVGGLTALVSFGLILIYRANRIVNFAQGDLGAGPAVLAVMLIVGPGLPYFVAMPIGILAGVALGALVEFVFIRRFFNAPRLILTVVTIGIAQLLAGLGLITPRFFDFNLPPQSFPSPFDFTFEIHPIIFRGNDVIAMLAVPVLIGSLALFFRYTHIGIAVRASAERADRAFLVGIPVKRIQTLVWVLAATLSTTAIILRAGIVGLPVGSVLGPAVLVRALAAAVIGRMERLPTTLVAALALGVLEQSIFYSTGRSSLVDPILFVVILGALLIQRSGRKAREDEASSWQSISEIRPVPLELRHLPEVRVASRVVTMLGLGFLLIIPALIPESRVNLVAVILIFTIIGLSLVVLTGWAGQVSLGQVAFVGIGAAVAGALTSRIGFDLSIALFGAGVVGALVAILIGLPALRMKGLFLAVTTLSFALATHSYVLSQSFFGWWLPQGRLERKDLFGIVAVDTEARYYYLCLGALLLALFAVRSVRRSRAGRVLISVRENERAAQAYGINATRAKLTAFGLSGFLAAFAGGLFVHHQQTLGINPYAADQSLAVFTMVVVGGLGSVPGAALGAIFIQGIKYFLPPTFQFFASGLGIVFILLLLPGGLGGLVYQVRDEYLRKVAARRNIRVPSLLADDREDRAVVDRAAEEAAFFAAAAATDTAPAEGAMAAPAQVVPTLDALDNDGDADEPPRHRRRRERAVAGSGRRSE